MSAKTMTLLTQKVQHFAVAPGGEPALTQEDICHALGMIKVDGASILGRVKYAGQHTFMGNLENLVYHRIKEMARRENWRIHRPALIMGLTRLALVESINPLSCPRCNGTKHRFVKRLKIECNLCSGTGRRKMTDYLYARYLKIDKKTWRTWKERYRNDILPVVDRLDAIVRGGLKKRLQ